MKIGFHIFLLILLSVGCSAVAQILLKTGMSQPAVAAALGHGGAIRIALQIAGNLWVLGGLTLYFLGALIWLFVLAKVDVSYAYPFVGVGFVITLFLGKILLGLRITAVRLVGTLLVSVGVVLIARQ